VLCLRRLSDTGVSGDESLIPGWDEAAPKPEANGTLTPAAPTKPVICLITAKQLCVVIERSSWIKS